MVFTRNSAGKIWSSICIQDILKAALHSQINLIQLIKVGLSPAKKNRVICLIESPLKMMKNAFYFILKVCFFSRLFGHVGKTA